ncbi:Uncharacterised protein [Klebsiella pneumoniae]|uniref:Uncharacterized protein n=1 Tax=Klebsiella pneumoniae TaxID=573 RepID=A0A378A7E6_KLEPN|nr:Uncharacterised protein [Klebsiella pneumoniae]
MKIKPSHFAVSGETFFIPQADLRFGNNGFQFAKHLIITKAGGPGDLRLHRANGVGDAFFLFFFLLTDRLHHFRCYTGKSISKARSGVSATRVMLASSRINAPSPQVRACFCCSCATAWTEP